MMRSKPVIERRISHAEWRNLVDQFGAHGFAIATPNRHLDPNAHGPVQEECFVCKSKDNLSSCTGCQCVSYCSKICQKTDWKADHKGVCKTLRDYDKKRENILAELRPAVFTQDSDVGGDPVKRFDLQKATLDFTLTIIHELESYQGLEQALNKCYETICTCVLWISYCEKEPVNVDGEPYQHILGLIPHLLLRLSREDEAYNFMRLWSESHTYWSNIDHVKLNEDESLRYQEQAHSVFSHNIEYMVDRWWYPRFALLLEQVEEIQDKDLSEWQRKAGILSMIFRCDTVLPPIYDIQQPVNGIGSGETEEAGWSYVPANAQWLVPMIFLYLKFLRDYRGLHNARFLRLMVNPQEATVDNPQGLPVQKLPNEIIDHIRGFIPDCKCLLEKKTVIRESGDYSKEIARVKGNIHALLNVLWKEKPVYWQFLFRDLKGVSPGYQFDREFTGVWLTTNHFTLQQMPDGMKMANEIYKNVWLKFGSES